MNWMNQYKNDVEWSLKVLKTIIQVGILKKIVDVGDFEGCKKCTSYHDEESSRKGRKKRKLVKS